MRSVLNLIWLVLGGVWLATAYYLIGAVLCALIVTIPAGLACFRMGRYVLWPFGSAVVARDGAGGGTALANGVWFVLVGWMLAVAHVLSAVAQSLTIIGIANAVVSLKMIPVSCFPFGKKIVDASTLAGRRPMHAL